MQSCQSRLRLSLKWKTGAQEASVRLEAYQAFGVKGGILVGVQCQHENAGPLETIGVEVSRCRAQTRRRALQKGKLTRFGRQPAPAAAKVPTPSTAGRFHHRPFLKSLVASISFRLPSTSRRDLWSEPHLATHAALKIAHMLIGP
ncbi:hypothetical protein BDV96DRAFT_141595 [Lophiotrema nucula]|uniref:Uncharacterized protein n=1 Tax=Lophiotrema nucula TaxID=690887 RepID=A0A6A5ZVL6_9PLEO|nr:hypothetical protein BDV96DRAFT_141595 [Lophiotrema nucula]